MRANIYRQSSHARQMTGVRVLGPNTAGHISTPANFTSSFFPLARYRAAVFRMWHRPEISPAL